MGIITKAIKQPGKAVRVFLVQILVRFGKIVNDETYIKWVYYLRVGKKLNLDNPQTFNEKIQWLKLNNKNPEYTIMVDKILVKDYVAKIIGEEYIIPTIATYDTPEEIDFDALPNQFVLKCNHDSGGLCICRDKSKLDFDKVRDKLRKSLKNDYFIQSREWPYKNVKRKILAEKLMVDESGYELKDYKLFCFDGKMKAMFIASDRFASGEETKFDFFDENFEHLPFTNGHPNASKPIRKPESFEKMKELAEKLSAGIPHVRVDFYDINGDIYFGELTFAHWSGLVPFNPEEWDKKFGEWIKLPNGGGYMIKNQDFILLLHLNRIAKRDLTDYKFFCFGDKVLYCQVISDRSTEETIDFYDMDWKKVEGLVGFNRKAKNSPCELLKPKSFEVMKSCVEKLAGTSPFSRIDMYEINGKCYFGEITFFPASGYGCLRPDKWNMKLGEQIKLA